MGEFARKLAEKMKQKRMEITVEEYNMLKQEIKELKADNKEWDIENSRLVSENVKQAKENQELFDTAAEIARNNADHRRKQASEIKELKEALNKPCDHCGC